MAGTEVKVFVELYPLDGAVGIQIEEKTDHWGWVQVLDTASVGTFPAYTTAYAVTLASEWGVFSLRHRWKIGASKYTEWDTPPTVALPASAPTTARFTQAVLAKAVRIYALTQAPLGTHGEMTEFGMARVMPDHQIIELLAGLIRVNWNVDLTSLVEVDDVVRALGYEDLPAAKDLDVQRAIDSAVSWVAEYIMGAVPIS